MQYTSANSKASAVARMYVLGGRAPEPLGPGAKEKRSAFEALGTAIGMDLVDVRSKHRCAAAIADAVGVEWDTGCWSAGDTITSVGINRLVDAVTMAKVAHLGPEEASELIERLLAAGHSNDDRRELMPEALTDVQQNVADYLARLSEPGPLPEDFGREPFAFRATDVRFDDGTWRQKLLEVEGWIRLGITLDDSSPQAFDASLAKALNLVPTHAGNELLAALALLLEEASARRDEFLQAMEQTAEGTETKTSASLAWAASWDDAADDDGTEPSGMIDARAETWPIQTFIQYARDDELDLSPSYQRADVWPTNYAQRLIESILRGIPLPSVIILEKSEDRGTVYEVVDGKQRLTSVLRFTGAHPHALDVVAQKSLEWNEPDLPHVFETDYPRFKEIWNKNERDRLTTEMERKNHFPFPLRSSETPDSPNPLVGDLAPLREKYYGEIRDLTIPVQGTPRRVRYVFEQAATYKIPVIIYKTATMAQIHEVFSLYNTQGKSLNAEEIRNALYHRLDLMRGLLVMGGDSTDLSVASFLSDDWGDLKSTSEVLARYQFGDVGYKRTKVLSWVAAALLLNDAGKDGITRSTSAHINALLQRVQADAGDPLQRSTTVRDLMLLIDHALDAHATVADAWPKRFRSGNDRGTGKWQELRLVATLVALSAAAVVLDDQLVDRLEDAVPAISDSAARWGKPVRNQSKEQWRWIGFVVSEILAILDVDPEDAHAALVEQFGSSGLKLIVDHAHAPEGYVRP
ncbi:DUF262 domain-containing protein [Promicromonospora sukumoe]|uniref:DUF262 domain-containing protein n=1 Tax=Promicromonospora sukumoe TaxID=88382 RepID=UPI00036BA6A7|nr:DUF262 domain-containing protein [Promicromonospora sukumoe]